MARAKKITVRRESRSDGGGVRFLVDCGIVDGKRKRRFFLKRADADEFAAVERENLRRHGDSAVSFSHECRVRYQAAENRLAQAGATIEQAVDYFLSHHRPLKASLTLGELLEKAVLEKELAGLRKNSLAQFACSCRSFISAVGCQRLASTVTREDVKTWIFSRGFAPKTQRTYLGDVRSLFSWAVQERYVASNPVAGDDGYIRLAEMTEGEIAVFDVDVCARLLRAALFAAAPGRYRGDGGKYAGTKVPGGFRPLIGYLAAAMFEGVRPEEVRRIDMARLNLRGRTMVIKGEGSKTRSRRVVELSRVAVVWLRLWRRLFPSAHLVPPNFRKRFEALREAAEIGTWPADVLRHTFASYHYAFHADRKGLQAAMGHSESEDTLDKHYRAVATLGGMTVSRKLAAEFWELTPRRVRVGKKN